MLAWLLKIVGLLGILACCFLLYDVCAGEYGFDEFIYRYRELRPDARMGLLGLLASTVLLVVGIVQGRMNQKAKLPGGQAP